MSPRLQQNTDEHEALSMSSNRSDSRTSDGTPCFDSQLEHLNNQRNLYDRTESSIEDEKRFHGVLRFYLSTKDGPRGITRGDWRTQSGSALEVSEKNTLTTHEEKLVGQR